MPGEREREVPAVLEPDFDLLGLDIREDRALTDQLLSSQGAGLWALGVDSLQGFHLLGGVPHVLAGVGGRRHVLAHAAAATAPTSATTLPVLPLLLRHHHRHPAPSSLFPSKISKENREK